MAQNAASGRSRLKVHISLLKSEHEVLVERAQLPVFMALNLLLFIMPTPPRGLPASAWAYALAGMPAFPPAIKHIALA